MEALERYFENGLWHSRLVVIIAVIASVLVGLGVFYLATLDTFEVYHHLVQYAGLPGEPLGEEAHAASAHGEGKPKIYREQMREKLVADIVEVIDGYLLGATMLIFALGLYELFISKIEAATESEHAENILLIRSLDDLKDRLAKMILLMMAIKFFQLAGRMTYKTPLDLLYMAIGVVMIAGSIYVSHLGKHGHHKEETHSANGDANKEPAH